MLAKLETQNGEDLYARRKPSVEPTFGIIRCDIGFTRVRIRGHAHVDV